MDHILIRNSKFAVRSNGQQRLWRSPVTALHSSYTLYVGLDSVTLTDIIQAALLITGRSMIAWARIYTLHHDRNSDIPFAKSNRES